ncbi:hypothetical protein [Chelativorans sp. Marseille-P2723]|uniref:hypothetical protein n=1 Tax=Chelativorans sp. Marseille-P2723 TaxID=2709133 RepID=UPI001570E4D2|nr:hypothetical protein [Chelativorans sp. Marseille-P2723]
MWQRIRDFFRDSETLFWARLQALLGLVAAGMAAIDPVLLQAVLTPKAFALYLFANGVITELLRRRRADDL